MKTLAIITGKITIFFGNILHRGSSLPGKLALKVDKKLLRKLKYPKIKIAITGSSGKGSTSALIANTLKNNNYKICFNSAGSNLAWGITSSILRSCTLTGKVKTDALIIEVDERYAKEIFEFIKPTYIVVTNLTKDQPPRQANVDIVYADVLKSINKEAKIITCMDEPYMRNFERDTKNEMIYYSIAKNKYSYENQIFENLNTYYCPYCGAKLEYEYYNFETLGKYQCSKCDFKYEEPFVIGENINLEEGTIKVDKEILKTGGCLLYHAYNTLAAITTLKSVGLKDEAIYNSINELNGNPKFGFETQNKLYIPFSCKAENASTYNQAVFKVSQDKDLKDIIIGWKEISRRYNHFDVSWLYDIEFELLNNDSLNEVYACGIDAENIKKRLILAGFPPEKIKTGNNIPEIKEEINKSEAKKVYGILNFDYIEPFEQTFKEENL